MRVDQLQELRLVYHRDGLVAEINRNRIAEIRDRALVRKPILQHRTVILGEYDLSLVHDFYRILNGEASAERLFKIHLGWRAGHEIILRISGAKGITGIRECSDS